MGIEKEKNQKRDKEKEEEQDFLASNFEIYDYSFLQQNLLEVRDLV